MRHYFQTETGARDVKNFQYHAPNSLTEALTLLHRHGKNANVLAGGTDLLVQTKRRVAEPRFVISAKKLPNLDYIEQIGTDGLKIGAFATLTAVLENPFACRAARFLSSVAKRMAGPAIRNTATVGGNLCNASPAADMSAGLIALGASAVMASEAQERAMPVEAFFLGPGKSARKPDEMLVRVDVPDAGRRFCDYQRLSVRKAIDIAIVGVAVSAQISEAGYASDLRIALGAVAPIPLRAKQAETIVEGQPFSEEMVREAAAMAASESSPITDVRASADYRRDMVAVLTRRALAGVFHAAKEEA